MVDAKVCEWLMDNADAPIRYRVAKELLGDAAAAKRIEPQLFDNAAVKQWLANLKPHTPPQHKYMMHGSFNFCFENAMHKCLRLGLCADMLNLADAASFYTDFITNARVSPPYRQVNNQMDVLLVSSLLTLAGFRHDGVCDFMLKSLGEMHDFVSKGVYDIFLSDEERERLSGVPSIWKDKKFIRKEYFPGGPVFPLIHDVVALHRLYSLELSDVTAKINDIIDYISADEFHAAVPDGYGIIIDGKNKYYGMGWDPKFPGWKNPAEYMESKSPKKLLFFTEHISNYSHARKTRWYGELLAYLSGFKTHSGTFAFPTGWLAERRGYAVEGYHLSYGENRRKKNWAEIESTFFMQYMLSKQ